MKLFKKSTLGLALTAALTGGAMMGVSAPTQAVEIAHNGLGQVLVFPYYTTRNGWNTYFNITNTSNKTVAIKVRWREAHNSRDVRDFNVILSPYDVWTAATVDGVDGARMVTNDNTCTVPQLPSVGSLNGVDFTNTAYIKKGNRDNRDKGPTDKDRTREGYFEVIEMGVIDGLDALNIARNAKHNNVGDNTATPRNCGAIDSLFANENINAIDDVFQAPENVLKGRAVLINAAKGIAAGYDPLVLKDFSPMTLIASPSSPDPSLKDADTGIAGVNALIMRNGVINDYNIATNSETDWVMTFPTKNFAVDEGYAASANFAALPMGSGAPLSPFDAPDGERFSGSQNGKSCFDVTLSIWDREEYKETDAGENKFSPSEPGEAGDRMCYEANILSFGDSDLFGSKVRKSIGTLPGNYGWANVGFGGNALPVIGMRVEVRNKGDASVNFAFANDHAFTGQ